MSKCFSPEVFRELRMVQDSADALEKTAVKRLCDAVMLWGVMCSEALLGAFLPKVFSEFMAGELTAMIRAKRFDFRAVLSACPSSEGLVCGEGLVFSAKDVSTRIARGVVCERDVIASASKTGNGGWSP